MKLLNFLTSFTLLLLFATTSVVVAQDKEKSQESFNQWDQDADSTLSRDEFKTGVSDMGYYDSWDSDGNDSLSTDEWNKGAEMYLVDYDYGDYNSWDEDGDGIVSEDEFDNGLFDLVDQDSNDIVEEYEFSPWWEASSEY